MSAPVKTLARPHAWVPTLVERLCRQRVLSAACLAPPIGTYTLFQPIKVNKHNSMPNRSFFHSKLRRQEYSVAQSRDRIPDA